MADCNNSINWRSVVVPEVFVNGMQCFRWADDGTASIVRLRIDKDGYILWWTDAVNSECISLFAITDVRCGRAAKKPKDAQTVASCLRFIEAFSISQSASSNKAKRNLSLAKLSTTGETANATAGNPTSDQPTAPGSPPNDTTLPVLTEQTELAIEASAMTVLYGADTVNPDYVNFIAPTPESAKEWSKLILEIAYRSLLRHGNMVNFLQLAYKELSVTHSERGKIPLKLLYRKFVQHRDDQEKVEKVLEACCLPTDKALTIKCADLTSEAYRRLIKMLLQRNDVENVFIGLGAQTKPYLHITAEQFVEFLNKEQRDPRLNEVLHPFYTVSKAEEMIRKYEPTAAIANKRHLSVEGFYEFLISEDNTPLPYDIFESNHDMNRPIAHYFVDSSHNTYLTGHQLTGKSSVEYYRYVLLTGCRCIELDCWDGDPPEEEPKITHGYTMVTQIPFKDVIDTIAACAFEVSEYPLILSFENHCTAKQQAKMVQYMKAALGETLLIDPLTSHPLEPGVPLPSPNQLKRKVIVKSKKRIYKDRIEKKISPLAQASSNCYDDQSQDSSSVGQSQSQNPGTSTPATGKVETADSTGTQCQPDSIATDSNASISSTGQTSDQTAANNRPSSSSSNPPMDSAGCSTMDARLRLISSEDSSGDLTLVVSEALLNDKSNGAQSDAQPLAALVNYVDPVPFVSFAVAESRQCSFESFSFVETQASQLLKMFPVEFVNFNKSHLSRMYPKGTRVDSSNFIPQLYWNAGVQMASLNFQTPDLGLQLNSAMFELNGRTGYVLKPDFMTRSDQSFDPFAQSTVDGIVAASLTVKIISGQFLSDRKVGTFIEIELFGVPHDTRRKQRTKLVASNALNPVYEDNEFEFSPIIVPQLAFLRLAAYDETSRLLGQRVMPVANLRPGYRHVPLRNEVNQPAGLATLFVRIRVRDYVPTLLFDFAEALVNPIAHQQQLHLREQQIALLTDEPTEDDDVPGPVSDRRNSKVMAERSAHSATKRTSSNDATDSRRKELRSTPTLTLPSSGMREALLSPMQSRKQVGQKTELQTLIALARRKSNTETSLPASDLSTDRSPADSPRRDLFSTQEKLAATVSGNKILQFQDSLWKDMLPEKSSVFSIEKFRLVRSFDDLKNTKEVQRLVGKLEKERLDLVKRHEKNRAGLLNEYGMKRPSASSKATTFARRLTSATVNAMTLAKTRSDRRRDTQHEITVDFDSAPTDLHHAVNALSRGSISMQTAQFTMRCAEIDRQYDVEVTHWLKVATDRMTAVVNGQLDEKFRQELAKLSALYEDEMQKMQTKQDRLRRETNKQLSKDVHNKNELTRSRQESLLQHIHYGVLARQQLISLFERERESLVQKQSELKRQIEIEFTSYLKSMSESYDQRRRRNNSAKCENTQD